MTLRTITFDDEQWQVVPREPTDSMFAAADAENDRAFVDGRPHGASFADMYYAALDAAPEPPAQQPMTDEEAEALIPPVLEGVPAGNLPHVSTGYLIAMMRAVERHHGIGKGEGE